MADSIEDRLGTLRAQAPAGSPLYTPPPAAGATIPIERAPLAPAAPNPANLDLSAWRPAPNVGGLNLAGWQEAPQNADLLTPGWDTTPGLGGDRRNRSIRESTRMSQRDLAAAIAAEPGLISAVEEATRRRIELLNDIERGDADETYWQDVAARLYPQFGVRLTPDMAREWTVAEIATVENYLANATRGLAENRVSRAELQRAIVNGQPRPSTATSAVRAAINNLVSMPVEVARGLGIAGDAVQYWLTGDTDQNALVAAMDAAGQWIDRGLPADPLSRSFAVELAGGAGSMAGFLLGGLAGKALAGLTGARVATGVTGGMVGGNQQYDMALQADADGTQRYLSWLAGFGVGATELIPLDRFLGRVETMTGGAISRRLRAAAIGAGEEGLQEFFQGLSADVIQRALVDPEHPIDWQSAQGQALIGAILGAGMGAAISTPSADGREITIEELANVLGGVEAAITPPAAPAGAPPAATPGAAVPPAGGPSPVGPTGEIRSRRVQTTTSRSGVTTEVETVTTMDGRTYERENGGAWREVPAPVTTVTPDNVTVEPYDATAEPSPTTDRPLPVAGDALLGQPATRPPVTPPTPVEAGTLIAAGYDPDEISAMDPTERAEAVTQAVDQGVRQREATAEQMAAIQASVENVEAAVAPTVTAVQTPAPQPIATPSAPALDISAWKPADAAPAPAVDEQRLPAAPTTEPGRAADAGGLPASGGISGGTPAPVQLPVRPEPARAPVPVDGRADGVGAEAQAAVGKLPPRGRSRDLLQFIASLGGIRATPELDAMDAGRKFVSGYGKFVRSNGRDADRIRELVAEAGYFGTGDRARAIAETTVDDLNQLVGRALAGERITPDDAEDMGFEADAIRTAEHEKYLDRLEGEIRAWLQEAEIENPRLLRMMVRVADEQAVQYGFDADTFADILERAAMRMADNKTREAAADEIPFDLHPDDLAAPAAQVERPGDATPGGGKNLGGGRPGDGRDSPQAGSVQGQAGEGVEAAAENPDAEGVVAATPAVDKTDAGDQLVLPGAEQITGAQHAQMLANKPLRPTVDQKPADDGLFGDSAAQTDLVDMAKAPSKPGDGEVSDALTGDFLQKLAIYSALVKEAGQGNPSTWRDGLAAELAAAEDDVVEAARINGLPGDSVDGGARVVESVGDVLEAFRRTPPEDRRRFWGSVGDEFAAAAGLRGDVAKPPAEAPAFDLRAALRGSVRPSPIKGMEGEFAPDPHAEEILGRPGAVEAVGRILSAEGITSLKPLSGGASAVVLDAGNRVVRLRIGAPREAPSDPAYLQPLFSGVVAGVGVEILPKVSTDGITEADVSSIKADLATRGLKWDDAGTDNAGRREDGSLVIIDGRLTPAGRPVEVDPEQEAEGQVTLLTAEGPWDFDTTYPDIDRAQYERLLNERPDPFDAAGEPMPEQITGMIDAILSDLQGRHTSILAAQAKIATAKPADKKKLEAEVAGTFESIKGLGEEMRGIWSGDAVNAILGTGRKRAAEEWKTLATPAPAKTKEPTPAPKAEEPAPEVKQPPSRERPAIYYPTNEETPLVQRLLGEGFKTIVSARTFARQNDERAKEATSEKVIDEVIEAAVVSAARRIVREGGDDQRAIYDRLVELYGKQPNLAVRTAKSMADQAYSTPVPLAYIASRLAGVKGATNVYEPTAGNGALLLEDIEMRGSANEIDDTRRSHLLDLGYNATGQDATEAKTTEYAVRHSRAPKVRKLEGDASRVLFDVVLMNPPFGSVREGGASKEWTVVGDYRTAQIDHAIALNALQAMKSDGKAVLIVGGVNPKDDRQEGYRAQSKRKFYARLYGDYNVVDHFTVAGPLYARQGAGWPVDVIVIHGRGKSARSLPAADVPKVFSSWDELAAKLPSAQVATTETAKPAATPAVNPDRKPIGVSVNGKNLFEDKNGVRFYVESGIRVSEPVGVIPGGGVSLTRPPKSPDFRLASEENLDQKPAAQGQKMPAPEQNVSTAAADDFDSMFDDALDDAFGKTAPKKTVALTPEREAAWQKKAAKVNGEPSSTTPASSDDAMKGLASFFNDPTNFGLGMGVGFDPNIYARVKPLLIKAAEKFQSVATGAADIVKRLVSELRDAYQMTREAIERLRPYVKQFMDDLTSGAIVLGKKAEEPPAPPPERKPVSRKANEAGQVPYSPFSQHGVRLNTLTPANLRQGTEDALQALQNRVGAIDAFVAGELGIERAQIGDYFSAEQVDALALAIDNAKRGSALVLGDQTGIGKGRVVAGMLRWAKRNGMTPVFFTEKPDLYGDMYRDLTDIGLATVDYYMTNTNENVPLNDAALEWVAARDEAKANGEKAPPVPKEAVFFNGGTPKKNMERRAEVLSGKAKPDVIFSTYDQINDDARGTGSARRAFFERLAPNAFFVLDEAHNAGGQDDGGGWRPKVDKKTGEPLPDPRAQWMRGVLKTAKGALYSSATYAKRPDTMTLYNRTDMVKAVERPGELPELISRGGVPLQQIVAGMLGRAGQYIRREKSFEGISYTPEVVEVPAAAYRDFTDAIRAIYAFDRIIAPERERAFGDAIRKALDAAGADVARDNAVGDVSADSTEFNSIMHNLVAQMLFSITADKVAAKAIEALRAGEKPVIALSSTMESFLTDYVAERGIAYGSEVGITFKDVVRRYLSRTLRITVKLPDGGKKYIQINPADLPPEYEAAYRAAETLVDKADVAALPVSPIDHIRNRLQQAGYSVAEVTGRGMMLDYSAETPILVERPGREQGASGKRVSIKAFNDGRLDALILNKSGSTGVSAHASPKVGRDTRPRRMVIAQADPNIDVYMQMLGRVNRTGQIALPSYTQIVPDVPAAMRPMAVLMKKMASLNANTTGARSGTFSATDVDMMNAYGDLVATQVMIDAPEWNDRMGDPVYFDEKGRPATKEPLKRVMGRMTLLWPDEQADLIDQLQSSYKALVERLEAAGENALEAKALDLQAIVKDSQVIRDAKGVSPFEGEVRVELLSVKSPGRAMAPDEVLEAAAQGAGVKVESLSGTTTAQKLDALPSRAGYEFDQKIMEALRAGAAWAKQDVARFKDEAKKKAEKRHDNVMKRFRVTASYMSPGSRVQLTLSDDASPVYGVVTRFERTGKTKNPLALSSWEVSIAVPDSQRMLIVPLSQLYPPGIEKGDEVGFNVTAPDYTVGTTQLLAMFDKARAEGREDRVMVTGNILSGFDEARMRGQIVTFTMEDGTDRAGILMPRGYTVKQFMAARAVRFAGGPQIRAFLDKAPAGADVSSIDNYITIIKSDGARPYFVSFDAVKAKGGRYYLEKSVRDTVGDRIQKGAGRTSGMNVFVSAPELDALILATQKLGASFASTTNQDVAEAANKGVGTGLKENEPAEPRIRETLNPLGQTIKHTDLGPRLPPTFNRPLPFGQKAREWATERGIATGDEHIVGVSRSGVLVVHGRGRPDGTGITERLWKWARQRFDDPLSIHHNHPRDSMLSIPDIGWVMFPGVQTIWAHGHGGMVSSASATAATRAVYTNNGRRQPDGKDQDIFLQRTRKHLGQIYDADQSDIDAGRLSVDEATHIYIMSQLMVARDMGFAIIEHNRPDLEERARALRGPLIAKAAADFKKELFGGRVPDDAYGRPADPARHFGDVGALPQRSAVIEGEWSGGGRADSGRRAGDPGETPLANRVRPRSILPGRRAEVAPLANDIHALIGRLVGPHPKVRFFDTIPDDAALAGASDMARMEEASGRVRNPTIGGSYRFNATIPAESLIEVALQDPIYDPRESAAHEAWHHIEFALLTEEEHSLIQRDLNSSSSTLIAIAAEHMGVSPSVVRLMPSYEITAVAFAAYVRRKERGQPLTGFHIGVRRAFDRLLDLFRAIARTLGRRGITKPEQIFETARVGRMRGRTAANGVRRASKAEDAFRAGEGLAEDGARLGSTVPSPRPSSFWEVRSEGFLARARRTFSRQTADAIRVKAQDSFLRWKRITQAIEADTGAKVGDHLNAYVTQSLFSGRAGERLNDLRRKYLEPLVEAMREAEVDPRSLGLYLYARHAFERNREIAAINPGYRDKNGDWAGAVDPVTGEANGSGMTDREAQAILDAIGAKLPVYEALAARVYEIRDWTLDTMVRFGLLSRDQADEWVAKYPDYVPLRGHESFDEGNSERARTGRGFDIRGKESFRALGRQSLADNPLAYIIMQAEQAIVRAEKNRVLRTVLNLIKAHPNDNIWKVTKSVPERYVDKETGLVRVRHAPPPGWSHERRDMFHGVKIGGQVTWIEFRGDVGAGLSRALRGVGREQSAIVGAMIKLARGWAMLQTSLNPEFVFVNFLRDLPTAVINVTDVDGRPLGTRRKILTDALTLKSIRGIRKAMKNPGTSNEVGRYFEEYRAAGGKISYVELNDVDRIKGRIEKMFSAGKLRRGLWAVADWIDGVNTAVENGGRLSVYIALRKNNFSKDAAASVARELTVNFNRKGEWGPVINSLYIFFNASTQGTFRMASAIAKSKKARRIVYGIVAYGFLSEFLNAFLADDDEEGNNAYDAIPDYVKERNMIFMIPGAEGAYIKIPMPYGYNVFYLAGQQLAAIARGQKTVGEGIGMLTLAALDAFNPIGTAPTLGQFLAPTLADPIVQISENRTWYGGNIAPTKYDQSKPDAENYWTDTPEGYVEIAGVLNEATGGTVGRAGWVDISPETIEHLIDFGIGGAGRFIANTVNSIRSLIEGDDVEPDEIPFARRLIAFPTAASARHAFWEAWDVIDQAHYETNEYRRQGMAEQFEAATEAYARELAVWRTFDRTRRAMNDIREAVVLVERDRTLSGEDRAARIREYEARERELIEAAIQAYEGAAN